MCYVIIYSVVLVMIEIRLIFEYFYSGTDNEYKITNISENSFSSSSYKIKIVW